MQSDDVWIPGSREDARPGMTGGWDQFAAMKIESPNPVRWCSA